MKESETFSIYPIGYIQRDESKIIIQVKEKYRPALLELDNFSHLIAVWWADRYAEYRDSVDMQMKPPYAPGVMTGLFATRSPVRPNPIMVSTCKVNNVDHENGLVEINQIDAFEGTPILDLKVYFPTVDRVKTFVVPERFKEWGDWLPEEGIEPEYYE